MKAIPPYKSGGFDCSGLGLFENRGNEGFLSRMGQPQRRSRKYCLRITEIFATEDGRFWAKRQRFRFFKQALKYKYRNRHFGAEGYYMFTVGLNESAIRKYIADQEKTTSLWINWV